MSGMTGRTPQAFAARQGAPGGRLRVLVVDDEPPAADELSYLLTQDARVAEVRTCLNATDGLQQLQGSGVDAVFLDIQMPGLNGLEVARLLARFKTPPAVVFVTAHEEHALEAFDLRAVDYVLKPVRAERLAETVTRLMGSVPEEEPSGDVQIPVELGGVTRFVWRSQITHVEAQGDYARLHTAGASHLVRVPLTQLEQEWASARFVRIHRSLLVNLSHVTEVRSEAGRCSVVVGGASRGTELQVSRRHTRQLKDLLARRS
ncbi:LytR/AlgR family response regulator transcription factor [Nocardioides albus]|uniref:DNA-binding LytR/AlgR family response regulator n=1 Tax=Nocardioides albus TaxID=1841 RepID=A0A7W5A2F3_9ACTN|nr:LytTR family DNA-binding domain-containing protein [Nocardioides albus]MBB3088233.1 DNA-binding LytR/AlgR family response regulator [Nocardioides albus]GGU42894.1 DNA-binding response regulator [Nocardioides albus]